ncbi:hypothetical protein N665_0009s0149 [Sinapis alba]|nr:hypothetical protein N665_0009s0149 [Sinapis alba]
MTLSYRTMLVISVYFVTILLVFSSCNAAARMGTMKVSEIEIAQTRSRSRSRSPRYEFTEGFRFKGRVFHFSSKRVLVPPSGPSKRHNSLVNDLKH